MNKHKTQKGFTLIELLLYVGLASTMLMVSTLLLSTLLESRIKNQAIAEVEQQGLQVMQVITQAIRNAESITSPTIGGSDTTLTLDALDAGSDPTEFDLSSGAIRITEGAGSPIVLTNSRVVATGLEFQNLSRASTPGIVRISFTLTGVNPSGRQEYQFTKTFNASATIRLP